MIDLTGMLSIPYLKKAVFTGSNKKMCFLLRKDKREDDDVIRAAAWPGPYNFSSTAEEKKVYHDFPFTADGLREAVNWLNAHYEAEFPEEAEAENTPRQEEKEQAPDGS